MFRHLTDKELLQLLSDKRPYSKVIDELCNRLENNIAKDIENTKIECPICSTNISLEFTDTDDGVDINIKAIK